MRPFLTARWESLVLLNYDCPAPLLEPLVPRGTELDRWRGQHVVSLVGFRFVHTRVRGVAIPLHRTFVEVNLRFYVHTREPGGGPRRAVVFVRELVPRRAIAAAARLLYNEPYLAVPMDHEVKLDPERGGSASYSWVHDGRRHSIGASVSGAARALEPGSEAEFITEHYWGYTAQRDGGTLEYRVDHPPWKVWTADEATYAQPPGTSLYGPELTEVLSAPPRSAFVAVGSPVTVYAGRRLDGTAPATGNPRGAPAAGGTGPARGGQSDG